MIVYVDITLLKQIVFFVVYVNQMLFLINNKNVSQDTKD